MKEHRLYHSPPLSSTPNRTVANVPRSTDIDKPSAWERKVLQWLIPSAIVSAAPLISWGNSNLELHSNVAPDSSGVAVVTMRNIAPVSTSPVQFFRLLVNYGPPF